MTELEKYLSFVKGLGFEVVLEVPFIGRDEAAEKLYVLFNRADSILLEFDTSNARRVNGGNFHFNWKSSKIGGCLFHATSCCGGGLAEDGSDIYEGYFDFRNSTESRLSRLRERGQFVSPWKSAGRLFLNHYMDNRESSLADFEDRKRVSNARIAMLPEFVRKAIGR